jgi:hypothetical protein
MAVIALIIGALAIAPYHLETPRMLATPATEECGANRDVHVSLPDAFAGPANTAASTTAPGAEPTLAATGADAAVHAEGHQQASDLVPANSPTSLPTAAGKLSAAFALVSQRTGKPVKWDAAAGALTVQVGRRDVNAHVIPDALSLVGLMSADREGDDSWPTQRFRETVSGNLREVRFENGALVFVVADTAALRTSFCDPDHQPTDLAGWWEKGVSFEVLPYGIKMQEARW